MRNNLAVKIDSALMSWVAEHRVRWLTDFFMRVMWLGTTLSGLLVVGVVVLIVCLVRRRPAVLLGVGLSVLITTVAAIFLKGEIHRVRPAGHFALVNTDGYSMPSTAAAMSAAALLPLIALSAGGRTKRIALVCTALVQLLVVVALIYLGAHWFTDTLAGTALGGVIGFAALRALTMRYERSGKTARP